MPTTTTYDNCTACCGVGCTCCLDGITVLPSTLYAKIDCTTSGISYVTLSPVTISGACYYTAIISAECSIFFNSCTLCPPDFHFDFQIQLSQLGSPTEEECPDNSVSGNVCSPLEEVFVMQSSGVTPMGNCGYFGACTITIKDSPFP